jgi:hypothetical protein
MVRSTLVPAFVAAMLLLNLGNATAGNKFSSLYDRFEFERCPIIAGKDWSSVSRCKTKSGPDFIVIRGEHNTDIMLDPPYSSGIYDQDDPSFKLARSGHFGDLYANAKGITTIEWRGETVGGKFRPFAAIYRTTYGADGMTGQRLDIVIFGPDHACPIAKVDASDPNHNAKAREIADAAWGTNPCPNIDRHALAYE